MLKKILVALLASSFIAGVAGAEGIYKLYGKAPLGRKIKPIEATADFPFEKSYRQFNEKQKAAYRKQWEGLGPNDHPPYPKKGSIKIYKPLIQGHAKISRGGMLRVVAQINEKGEVSEVAVYESPHQDITELAMSVMFHTKFVPGSCDGKPCKMDFPLEFKLRQRVKEMNTLNSEDIPGKEIN